MPEFTVALVDKTKVTITADTLEVAGDYAKFSMDRKDNTPAHYVAVVPLGNIVFVAQSDTFKIIPRSAARRTRVA